MEDVYFDPDLLDDGNDTQCVLGHYLDQLGISVDDSGDPDYDGSVYLDDDWLEYGRDEFFNSLDDHFDHLDREPSPYEDL